MPRVMETANSNFYSDITWPLPRLPSGQERPGNILSISDDFKKNLVKKKRIGKIIADALLPGIFRRRMWIL